MESKPDNVSKACNTCIHKNRDKTKHPCNCCYFSPSSKPHVTAVQWSEGKSAGPKVVRHDGVCEELNALYEKKNADYGDSFSKTFAEYGMAVACIRLSDKLERLKRLTKAEAEVKDESIRDTLVDLANYAIMTIMEVDSEKEQG